MKKPLLLIKRKSRIQKLTLIKFFAERCQRTDMNAFMQILTREGGQPPQAGDER